MYLLSQFLCSQGNHITTCLFYYWTIRTQWVVKRIYSYNMIYTFINGLKNLGLATMTHGLHAFGLV